MLVWPRNWPTCSLDYKQAHPRDTCRSDIRMGALGVRFCNLSRKSGLDPSKEKGKLNLKNQRNGQLAVEKVLQPWSSLPASNEALQGCHKCPTARKALPTGVKVSWLAVPGHQSKPPSRPPSSPTTVPPFPVSGGDGYGKRSSFLNPGSPEVRKIQGQVSNPHWEVLLTYLPSYASPPSPSRVPRAQLPAGNGPRTVSFVDLHKELAQHLLVHQSQGTPLNIFLGPARPSFPWHALNFS